MIQSTGPDETFTLGLRLGKTLGRGDIVLLYGELGAGKTVFVKGIASAFGIDDRDVTSASYTIVSEHPSEPPFIHMDLYRLESEIEAEEAGVFDLLGGSNISVVEWAERISPPPEAIRVTMLIHSPSSREIIIEGTDEERCNSM